MRHLKFVSKLAAAMLQAILKTVLAVVSVLCRFLGIAPPAMPALPQPSTTPEDVRDEYRQAYAAEAASDRCANDLGGAVYRYASADDPAIRCAIDLSGLSPAQTDWLLGLRDEDLKRLAIAGPKACELAALGKRSGVIGLSVPSAPAPKIQGPHPVRDLLIERIRGAQAAGARLVS